MQHSSNSNTQAPKNDKESDCLSLFEEEASSNNDKQTTTRAKRTASQAAQLAIGKIARFEQIPNNKNSSSDCSFSKFYQGISDE